MLTTKFSADTFNCVKADDVVNVAAAACKTKGDVDMWVGIGGGEETAAIANGDVISVSLTMLECV